MKIGDIVTQKDGDGKRMRVIAIEGNQVRCLFHGQGNAKVVCAISADMLTRVPARLRRADLPARPRPAPVQATRRVLVGRKATNGSRR